MSKFLKGAALLLITSLLLTVRFPEAFASDYVSIQDIKKETQEGWHQTYTFNGETIAVDRPFLA